MLVFFMSIDQIILGNIYTLDKKVEAICVKDGIIKYVGSKRVANKLIDENTEILDFGDNFIYPGFMDGHAHGLPAGNILGFSIDLLEGRSLEDYVEITRKYIEEHPGRKIYCGNNWVCDDEKPTAAMLDEVSRDVPIALTTLDGHSIWLNTAAMEKFGIDEKLLETFTTNEVHVDEDGKPTGYLSEEPAIAINSKIVRSDEELQESLLIWQDYAFSQGITAAFDAHVGYFGYPSIKAYVDVSKAGKLKLRTYAVRTVHDTDDVLELAELASKVNNEYFNITGIKVFVDGVVEAHTAWLLDEYYDQPGYFGVKSFSDHDKLVEFAKLANEHNMNVHCHTVGDGAIEFALDALSEAQIATGNMGQRNAFAHLQIVAPEDIKRMSEYNVIAVVPPLWTPKEEPQYKLELEYLGPDRDDNCYPIKSFIDEGAIITFHSDYPVSPVMSMPQSIYAAVKRKHTLRECEPRNLKESIGVMDALKAMTINTAYQFGQEDHLGSLEIGKVANMVVYDTDFLNDDIEKIPDAKLISTIVDGEVVFSNNA